MKVESILRSKGTKVVTTRPDATIATVVGTFKREGIGAMVVTADGRHVLGVISETDIISGLAEHGARLLRLAVADLVHGGVAMCNPDDSLEWVMARMTHRRVRHLPVVEDGALCGIVSIGDVVKSLLHDLQLEANVLRDVYKATQSRLTWPEWHARP